MANPGLTIQTSAQGVDRLIVHVDREDSATGFDLLRRVLPLLQELDRRTRAGQEPTEQARRRVIRAR